jgi:hypothetical protein
MSIQKSVAKNLISSENCVIANSKMGSQTMPLLIQKSPAKTVLLMIQKSTAMVESFQLTFFFWCLQ